MTLVVSPIYPPGAKWWSCCLGILGIQCNVFTFIFLADMTEKCPGTDTQAHHDADSDMEILGNLLEGDLDAEDCLDVPNSIPETSGLSTFQEELKTKEQKKTDQRLRLTDLFGKKDVSSVIHSGVTVSSEDEDNEYFEQQHLNDYGKCVKTIINHQHEAKDHNLPNAGSTGRSKTWREKGQLAAPVSKSTEEINGLKFDPISGIRVVNPLVSSATIQDKLVGRKLVAMSYIQNHINNGDLDADWVTIGVIVQKSNVQKSQKGSQYSILTLSDLKIGLKKVSLFLFSGSFKAHWKHPVGTVLGILNPSILNNRDSGSLATLSIDNAQKIMVIGTSKDFGYCKSWKKNGEKCTAFVNMGSCEYCAYHVQSEYKKFSQRSELQSPTGGSLQNLRNKVLGKNEVFYGGKTFVASKKVSKNKVKDEQRLKKLSDFFENPKLESGEQSTLISKGLSFSHQMKDAHRLNMLMENPGISSLTSSSQEKASPSVLTSKSITRGKCVLESLSKLDKRGEASPSQIMKTLGKQVTKVEATPSQIIQSPKFSQAFLSPVLGRGSNDSGTIDLECSFNKKQRNKAKCQALEWIKKNGPLEKSNPNSVKKESKATTGKRKRSTGEEGRDVGTSQNVSPNNAEQKDSKNSVSLKFSAEKMKELMEKGSKHAALLEIADLEAEDKYFHNLEKKEQMEEKMLNTFKLECKAVRCLKCKYLAFSASEYCKSEGHPTKVVNAIKRFYKCHDCGNRTVSLELFPVKACSRCGSAHWERAPMMREKKGPILPSEVLSIRGHEEKYVGAIQTGGNLDLLLPE